MPAAVGEFDRTSLVRLPLPLAQLLRLAHDGPDARARHRYAIDLFEATIKLAASVLVAAYVRELQAGGPRAAALDATWKEFKRPSLGHWVAILRELSRYFGRRADAASHPLGHVAAQLEDPLRDRPALLELYRRINKKGAGGAPKNVESCSVSGVIEEINAYRNDLAHGADRGDDFYNDMATRLLSAANELLAEETLDLFGPRGSRLVCLGEIKQVAAGEFEVGLRELTGAGTIRIEPTRVNAVQATALLSNRVAVVWPGHTVPLRLDPLLDFRDSKLHEEVQFLNAVRGKQLEYLGYFSGETPRDAEAAASLASLLALVLGHGVEFGEETPLAAAAAPREFEIIAEIGRGGMGVVYLARQLSLGRLVALKTLPAELSGDEVALARFDREIRALGQCDDPHIVKVLTSGRFPDGQRYYAMEYVPGADLEFVWRELSGKNREGSSAGLGGTSWSRAVLTACHKQRTETAHRAGAPTVAGAAGGLTRHHSPTGELNDAAPRSSAEAVALWAQLPPLPELPAVEHDAGGYARRVAALIRDAARALQAVHDQNIVHRDVSPANLMLTPDGARIVLMDFGLAKGNTRTLEASRSAGLLGKLRYAAPEQLAAANVKVGPRADIRGLGVTLWELLTRERLFGDAEDERQLTGWVLNRRLPRIRAIDPTLDRDLEAIVAKATENDQNDRLGSARELAELLDLYLAGKTVWVRVPGPAELLRRWVREHRGLVRLAIGAAAAIVLIVVIAFAKINAARNEAVEAKNEAVESEKKAQDLAREKSALAAEKTALADSERQARERADRQSELAMKTLNSVVFDIQAKLAGVPGAQEVRRSLLNTAIEGLKQVARTLETVKTADHATIASHVYLGDTFLDLVSSTGSATEEARKQYDAAQELAVKLALADPSNAQAQRDLSLSYGRLGDVQLRLGDAAAARDDYQKDVEICRKLALADPSNAKAQRELSVSYGSLGDVQLRLGDAAAARDDYQKGLEISRTLALADPSNAQAQRDLSLSYRSLGNVQLQLGDAAAARDDCQKDVEICRKLAQADPSNAKAQRDLSVSYNKLGDVQLQLGDTAAARDDYQKYVEICRKLAQADPGNTQAQRDLSISYGRLGDVQLQSGDAAAARDDYQKDLEISRKLAQADPSDAQAQRDLSVSYDNLGNVQLQSGDAAAARDDYQKGLEISRKLALSDPSDTQAQRDLSVSYDNLGDVQLQLGDAAAARDDYQKSLEILRKLAQADPSNAQAQCDLSISYNKLGNVQLQSGDAAAARDDYQKGLEISRKQAQADPSNAQAQRDLSISYNKLGDVQLQLGDAAAARDDYQKGLEISRKQAQADPSNAQAQRELSVSYNKLGDVQLQSGDAAAARDDYQKGLEIRRKLALSDLSNTQAQRDLSVSYDNLGDVQLRLGDAAAARDDYQKGLEISRTLALADPSNAQAQRDLSVSYDNLGDVQLQLGDAAAARDDYQKDLEISRKLAEADPSNAQAQRDLSISYNKLGNVQLQSGDAAAARDDYQKGLEISRTQAQADPRNTQAQADLAYSFGRLGRLEIGAKAFAAATGWFEQGVAILSKLDGEGKLAGQPRYRGWLKDQRDQLHSCQAALAKEAETPNGNKQAAPAAPAVPR